MRRDSRFRITRAWKRVGRWLPVLLIVFAIFGGWARGADDRTEIEVAIFAGGEGVDFFQTAAREYEKVNPKVKVNLYGDPRIEDKLRVRIIEGNVPDLTNAILAYHQLIEAGQIATIEPYLNKPSWDGDGTWRDSFVPGALDLWSDDGKAYGVPLSFYAYGFFYNKGMFEKHGWKTPATWDELLALCEKIKQAGIEGGEAGKPAFYPVSFQGQYTDYIRPVIDSGTFHGGGRKLFEDQEYARKGTFDNPNFVRALTYVHRLAGYFQPGTMGLSHTQSQMEFFLGHTAMIPCGSWLKSEMMGKIPGGFRLGFFNLPSIEGSKEPNAIYVYGGYFFLFKHAKHPKEAMDFMRFMTSRKMAGLFSRMRDIPTAVKGTLRGNLDADMEDLIEVMEKSTSTYGEPQNDSIAGMLQHWNNAKLDVLTGARTPEKIAKDMESAAAGVRNRIENPDQVTVRHVWKPVALLALLGGGAVLWVVSTVKERRKKKLLRKMAVSAGRDRISWGAILVFLMPAVVIYTAFVVVPSVVSFGFSVVRWNGMSEATYVGLEHFRRLLFEDDQFWIALKNNLFIMFVIPAFALPISLFLSVCLNRGLWGSSVFRVTFFFPNIIGGVAATLMWMHLYNPQGGPVNALLTGMGFSRFDHFAWLSQDHLYWALVPMGVWAGSGFNMILFLAAMQGIPADLYEAADLDGASQWRQFWTITLPMIWSAVSVSVVFMIIGGMKAFEVIWLLTNQQPKSGNHVIGTEMVQAMFQEFRIGEATAIAVVLFLMVFVGTAATLKLMNRNAMELG